MHLLYSAALAFALLLSAPWWLWRLLTTDKYSHGLEERLGGVPARLRASKPDDNTLWIHAVSVGEVLTVSGLVKRLQEKFPGWRIVVSTTTFTGQTLARERFGAENVFYLPLDFAFAIRPYLTHLRPRLLVLAETEFWPNLLRMAKSSGARIAVVNARISDRSFPRYRSFRGWLRPVLANIDLFLAQSETDKERLLAIGADAARVQVSGNLKFEVKAPPEITLVNALRTAMSDWGVPSVIVAGSTVSGEEDFLIDAFKEVLRAQPDALLILAPRHPERFDAVADLIRYARLPLIRRTEWKGDEELKGAVFLLNSIGELGAVYALATLAFVGGSLVPRGGHNILEPAQFGVPILVGPHTENFRDIVSIFRRANAVRVVPPLNIISETLLLLADTKERERLGRAAKETFHAHAGATQRTLDALEVLLWMPSTLQPKSAAEKAATP